MNAFLAFPLTPLGVVVGLISRMIAFLAVRIRASGLGMIPALTPEARARIVAFVARLLALPRNFARLAERARRGEAARGESDWMAASVPASLRVVFVAEMASFRRASLIAASPQVDPDVWSLARAFGVVLPAGRFPTADKAVAKVQAWSGEPACYGARAARRGQMRGGPWSKPRNVARTGPCPRAAPGARPPPVANFRQAFATG